MLISWMRPFLDLGVENAFIFAIFCIEIPVSQQCRPSSDAAFAASYLGLHCLHMSPKRVSGLKKV